MDNLETLFRDSDSSAKTPLKRLEVPIQKFNAAVPHFVELTKTHKNNLMKLKRLNQTEDMKKEIIAASRTVNQLESLLNEMVALRTEVLDSDLIKFEKSISSCKQQALNALQLLKDIPDISEMKKPTSNFIEEDNDEQMSDKNKNLQALADISEEVKNQEKYAASLERIQEDIQDINCVFHDLSQLVQEQGETVSRVERDVEETHMNVVEGERALCQAAKYQRGAYPLLGALLGSVLGGPVGLLAGMKLGSLTAIACGILGFTGGKLMKNQNESTIIEANQNRLNMTT